MHRRLQTITAMRDELLLGDDEAVRVLATDLADDLRTNPKPERWHELVAPMISDLEQAQTLASVEALAPSVARLAVRCGNCHRTLDPPITLPEFVHPPDGDSPKERMQQHLWAADRMWEGLIGPSTERWVRGTTVFTVLPGCGGASSDEQPERAKLCARVQSLVRHGHAETSTGGQGDVYGRLLATCAACHALEP